MSNPIPGLLALTSIADGSAQQAAPIRNNYSAIQTAVNEVLAALNSGAVGQPLQSAGATALQWGPKTTVSTFAGGPPGGPADQDIWIATAVDGNGTRWAFQYNAGSASAFKWEFIGGPPSYAFVVAQESTTTTNTWLNLTTGGPSFAAARGGDYLVHYKAEGFHNAASALMAIGVAIGDTAPSDEGDSVGPPATGAFLVASNPFLLAGVAAASVLKIRYWMNTAGTATFRKRALTVTPVRIS